MKNHNAEDLARIIEERVNEKKEEIFREGQESIIDLLNELFLNRKDFLIGDIPRGVVIYRITEIIAYLKKRMENL